MCVWGGVPKMKGEKVIGRSKRNQAVITLVSPCDDLIPAHALVEAFWVLA